MYRNIDKIGYNHFDSIDQIATNIMTEVFGLRTEIKDVQPVVLPPEVKVETKKSSFGYKELVLKVKEDVFPIHRSNSRRRYIRKLV